MYAVISDRKRQATVRVGDVLACDFDRTLAAGDSVTFDQVLLIGDEGQARVGTPTVKGAKVTGEVLGTMRGEKVTVFRFKRRKNVKVKNGHRQDYTAVRVTGVKG